MNKERLNMLNKIRNVVAIILLILIVINLFITDHKIIWSIILLLNLLSEYIYRKSSREGKR